MIDAAELMGPSPCDRCGFWHHCKVTGDACESFAAYCDRGRSRDMARQPRADLGVKLGYREKEAA